MPARVLAHRRAPTTESGVEGMDDGEWSDLTMQGQFLMDLEFLTLYTQPPRAHVQASSSRVTETACVYTQTPPYLKQIACQFPWVHFYCFRDGSGEDYDPDQPGVTWTTRLTLQTELNRTVSAFEFTKDNAIALSKAKEARPEHRLVMICHGESDMRQAVLHALLRADYSLLDVSGTIQEDYLDGEIMLPIMLPRNRIFTCLVASHPCKCVTYDQDIYEKEIGFFQGTLRSSEAYDQASADLIINEYAQRFQWFHRCHPDAIRVTLQSCVESMGIPTVSAAVQY